MKYIVGHIDREYKWPARFYRDTRNEGDGKYGGWDDIFTSSTDPLFGTQYETLEAAREWAVEFLQFGYSILKYDGKTLSVVEESYG